MKRSQFRLSRFGLLLILVLTALLFLQGSSFFALAAPPEAQQVPLQISLQLEQLRAEIRAKHHHFTVGYNPAMAYSIDRLCSLAVPSDWDRAMPRGGATDVASYWQASTQEAPVILGDGPDLPTSFDWRALDGVTPVRSQGGCGSCWAFGTVAPLESALKIQLGISVDLSEQYLVSCNTDDWDCGGGWFAHDYHEGEYDPSEEYEAGAVYETDFPYVAYDASCNGPHPHAFVIDSWDYVPGGGYWRVSPVEDIKEAIFTYGPVSAAVAVGPYFHAYRGGVFDRDEAGGAPSNVNHAVTLVGWNDDYYGDGSDVGVWILKNSWGTGWGENGYMNITYSTSNVGYAACYIELDTSPPVAPSDLSAEMVSTTEIDLSWSDNSDDEAGFRIERKTGPEGSWSEIIAVEADSTAYSDSGLVPDTTYYYRVKAFNVSYDSEYSNEAWATTAPPAQVFEESGAAIDYGGLGLWYYDSADLVRLTPSDPEWLCAYSDKLLGDFGSGGLWEYDGASWSQLTRADADNAGNTMVAYGDGMAVDFGATGVWYYDGSGWARLTRSDPEWLCAYSDKLLGDFGSEGLWEYDGSSWARVDNMNPDNSGNCMVGVGF